MTANQSVGQVVDFHGSNLTEVLEKAAHWASYMDNDTIEVLATNITNLPGGDLGHGVLFTLAFTTNDIQPV